MTDTIYVAQQSLQDYGNMVASYSSKDIVFIIIAILNLLTLGVTIYYIYKSPITAVKTAEYLQKNRSDSDRIYNNKFYVFATILGYRHALGYNENFVVSINQVPIVFHENNAVVKKLERFIQKHKSEPFNSNDLKDSLNDLIIAMAQDLNYPHIDNQQISSDYFYPRASEHRYRAEDMANVATVNGTKQEDMDSHLPQTDTN